MEPKSPTLQADSLLAEPQGKPWAARPSVSCVMNSRSSTDDFWKSFSAYLSVQDLCWREKNNKTKHHKLY